MDEEVTILDKNIDINQALKEFETKQAVEEVQNKVTQDESKELPVMVRWVIKLSGGAIKEQKAAEWVLLVFIVVIVGVSVVLVMRTENTTQKPSASAIQEMQEMQATINH